MTARAGSQGDSGLSPTQAMAVPGSCPAKGERTVLNNKVDSWRHPGTGASGCHLILECTGISSTPGDTQSGGEIAKAPLEHRMEPVLVRT